MIIMQREFEPSTWKACWETAFAGRPAAEVAEDLGMSRGGLRREFAGPQAAPRRTFRNAGIML